MEDTANLSGCKKIVLDENDDNELNVAAKMDKNDATDIRLTTGVPSNVLELYVKNFTLHAKPTDTVHKLKQLVFEEEGTDPCQSRLIYKGKMLKDNRSLLNYKIKNGDKLRVVVAFPPLPCNCF